MGLPEAELKEQCASAHKQQFLSLFNNVCGKIPSAEHRLSVCLHAVQTIPKGLVARMCLCTISGVIPVETY